MGWGTTHTALAAPRLQGVLTPFDSLDGFQRRVERGPGPAQRQRQQQQQGAQGVAGDTAAAVEQESIARMAEKVRALKAARPTTKLMEAEDLPQPERPTRWGGVEWVL